MPGELISVSERDEAIFALWEGGEGLRTIAREVGISRMEVEQALDRVLPVLSQVTNGRAYKRHLFFMEDLETEFYAIAKSAKSDLRDRYDAAHLCARLNERVCAMNGWSSFNLRMDPVAAQAAEQPSRHDRIREVIMRLIEQEPPAKREAHDLVNKIGGERALELLKAGSGNGAAVPSDAPVDDPEPK